MQFTVWIVSPPGYPHAECFRDVAETICDGLIRIGHDAAVTTHIRSGTKHIVLGAHLLALGDRLPEDSIIYNLEQLPDNANFATAAYYDLLRRHQVWDYTHVNMRELSRFGISVAALLPISYHAGLTKIAPAPQPDIDVLFIGSMNPRRQEILSRMDAMGLRTMSLFNKYGPARDAFIARAKLLLNVHFYPAKILEQVRISYYLANCKAVLSEMSKEVEVDANWRAGVCLAPYEDLAREAKRLCDDDAARRDLAQRGFAFIRQRDITSALQSALASTAQHQTLRRNVVCPCGSGQKYKRCHGALA